MNPKKLTLIVAAIAIVADAGVAIAGLLPPSWALVVGALVAGLTALDRALHNVAQGVSLKSYLTSPSAWAAAMVIVASIITAIAGVVPVTYATGVAVFAGMVLRFARVLQTALQPASGLIPLASPGGLGTSTIPSAAAQAGAPVVVGTVPVRLMPTPPTGTPHRGPYGSGPGAPGAVALLVLAGSLLLASTAFAQAPSPQLGFCVDSWNTCFQPAAAVSAFQLNLKTLDYYRVALMAGYGGVWHGPIDLGAAVYVGAGISATAPNSGQASLLFSFSDLAAAGPGVQVFKDPLNGNLVWQGLFTFAVNYNVGASPTYLRKTAAQQSAEGFHLGVKAQRDTDRAIGGTDK